MNLQKFLAIWRQIPFSKLFEKQKDFTIGAVSQVHANILKSFYPDYPLLPIEFLKHCPDQIEAAFQKPVAHFFLSSGTSQRDRSRSSFSKEGIDLYHEFSLLSFRAMLACFFPAESKPAGYSFIPSPEEWTTSSLAQMVSWIGEEFPLTYWTPDSPLPQQPVWLFATGFHLVSFADEGRRFPLPAGSVVIETGGTKGKTRSVTREELYSLISDCFAVDHNHIVSEYGMCELASQAYDFIDQPMGTIVPLERRWFRFPAWVQTKVLAPDQSIGNVGDGSLIIDDRIRNDLGTPFRTEDRALVREDGAFQLKGRVAFSPLKGCSLLAEDLLKSSNKIAGPTNTGAANTPHRTVVSPNRAETLHRLTQQMMCDPEFHALVLGSLGQNRVAEWFIDDLRNSIPRSTEAWIEAAKASQNQLESWLFIPPRTHDFAVVHPLFLAALLDLRILVRPSADLALLQYWQKLFKGFWQFEFINSAWRLETGEAFPAAGLLVFGSDETIAELRAASLVPVQGFGTWLTVSIIHRDSWLKDDWVKDAFSLKQQGCMSSRLLFVWDDKTPPSVHDRTVNIGSLTHGDYLHLAHSELDMALDGYTILARPSLDDLLLGHKAWNDREGIQNLLSSRPLTLPVIRISRTDLDVVIRSIEADDSFKLVSCDAASKALLSGHPKILTRTIGQANTAPWNGVHGRQALFFSEG